MVLFWMVFIIGICVCLMVVKLFCSSIIMWCMCLVLCDGLFLKFFFMFKNIDKFILVEKCLFVDEIIMMWVLVLLFILWMVVGSFV